MTRNEIFSTMTTAQIVKLQAAAKEAAIGTKDREEFERRFDAAMIQSTVDAVVQDADMAEAFGRAFRS